MSNELESIKKSFIKSIEERHKELQDVLDNHELIMYENGVTSRTTRDEIDEALAEIDKLLDDL